MAHDHHHHEHAAPQNVNDAFIVGVSLNFLFVIIEAVVGFYVNSLSLLSDAGHNLADVIALSLSLLAFRLMRTSSNKHYTYGYRKTSILVALFNGMVLIASIGAIVYEAIHRLFEPKSLPGDTIAWVAAIGIVINGVTALMFLRDRKKDLNVKGAYLHLLSDTLVSLALVVGGIIIHYTDWFWIDPVLSIIVALTILFSTWNLLKESLRLSLDGVPADMNLQQVKDAAIKINGIEEIHHIHLWGMSTTENALTAHIVVDAGISLQQVEKIKHDFRHALEHLNIQHITLEVESSDMNCEAKEHKAI
ncbi:MAG: cation transporter [Bacteroidetes bacterium]|nr:cation transporter [Bacteroidota bacterium]